MQPRSPEAQALGGFEKGAQRAHIIARRCGLRLHDRITAKASQHAHMVRVRGISGAGLCKRGREGRDGVWWSRLFPHAVRRPPFKFRSPCADSVGDCSWTVVEGRAKRPAPTSLAAVFRFSMPLLNRRRHPAGLRRHVASRAWPPCCLMQPHPQPHLPADCTCKQVDGLP